MCTVAAPTHCVSYIHTLPCCRFYLFTTYLQLPPLPCACLLTYLCIPTTFFTFMPILYLPSSCLTTCSRSVFIPFYAIPTLPLGSYKLLQFHYLLCCNLATYGLPTTTLFSTILCVATTLYLPALHFLPSALYPLVPSLLLPPTTTTLFLLPPYPFLQLLYYWFYYDIYFSLVLLLLPPLPILLFPCLYFYPPPFMPYTCIHCHYYHYVYFTFPLLCHIYPSLPFSHTLPLPFYIHPALYYCIPPFTVCHISCCLYLPSLLCLCFPCAPPYMPYTFLALYYLSWVVPSTTWFGITLVPSSWIHSFIT